MNDSCARTPFDQVHPDEPDAVAPGAGAHGAATDPRTNDDAADAAWSIAVEAGSDVVAPVVDSAGVSVEQSPWDVLATGSAEALAAKDTLNIPAGGVLGEGGAAAEESVVPLLALQEPTIAHGPRLGMGGWTLVALCVGMAMIACCVLIPQADVNQRLAWEHERLKMDLEQIQKQIGVNDEFLARVADDPTLAERLAQRQMQFIRSGTSVLRLDEPMSSGSSPFLLVKVPSPAPWPEFVPQGGVIARLVRDPRTRMGILGGGMLLVAAGLVLGYTPRKVAVTVDEASM